MKLPKVSIVITVKNEEENISRLLDSIERLDYRGTLETIVVDGGSTDRTAEIVSRHPFAKLITCNSNVSEGRNIGIKNSIGDLIAMTDGDCVVDREWVKNIVKHFDENPKIAVVGGPYLLSTHTRRANGSLEQALFAYISSYFPSKSGFASYNNITGGNSAYRREVVEKIGGFDEQLVLGEDIDLNFRISEQGYELLFANDVKVYHKFRATLNEVSKWAYRSGSAHTFYSKLKRRYRELLFPYIRTTLFSLGILFIANVLMGNTFLACIELLLLPLYYSYRSLRLREPYKSMLNLKARLIFPIIDLYIHLLNAVGSSVALLKTLFGLGRS